ncbi:MAG: hypothetical protein M3450_04815 [Actinomycetota bacterium]|nr:hypothetical protein [Actinomycetota bacterium]
MKVRTTRATRTCPALTAMVIAAILLAAACGNADDGTQASSEDVSTSAPAAGATAAKVTGGDGAFCDAVKAQFAQLSSVGDASSLDAAVRQQYFIKQKDLNAKVREAAPSGVRSDVDTQTGASDALADARIRGDAAASAAIARATSPETRAAGTRVSAYVKDHCGFEATTGGG